TIVGESYLGDVHTVSQVKGNWLWIADRKGYLLRTDVVPVDQAIDYFTRKLRGEPSYLNYVARGNIYRELKDADRAVADFTAAIRRDPEHALAYSYRAQCWEDLEQFDKAVADYTALIRRTPNPGTTYAMRARAYQALGDSDRALADYGEAIRLGRHWYDYVDRGLIWAEKKQWDRAISDYTEALSARPNDCYTLNERGRAKECLGDVPGAIEDYSACLRIDPQNQFALESRATIYRQSARFDDAVADLTSLASVQDSDHAANTHNLLAWIYATCPLSEVRDPDKALKHATQSCGLSAKADANRIDTLAAAHAEAGDFERAVELQKQATDLASADQRADYQTRLASYQKRKPHRDPKMRTALLALYSRNAGQCVESANHAKAIEIYDRMLKVDPDHAPALLGKAKSLAAREEFASAIATYGEVIATGTAGADVFLHRAELHRRLNNNAEAIVDLIQALQRDPGNPAIYIRRGELALESAEPAQAVADFTMAIQRSDSDRQLAELYKLRSAAFTRLGDASAGAADLCLTARLRPGDAAAWRKAAAALLATNADPERTRRYALTAFELTSRQDAEALSIVAACYAKAGQYELAAHLQRQVVSLTNGDEEAKSRLQEFEDHLVGGPST
ncbi:MAG: tetratricopeptide repeat protein, partial [Planctomycetaceae bacterium]|nr:tetratricopeptide repeat protein [Planctomycetaceae bacterium]